MPEVPFIKYGSGMLERSSGSVDSLQLVSLGIGTSAPATGTSTVGPALQSQGNFSVLGDARVRRFVARNKTTNATLTELFLNGASTVASLPDDSTWSFEIRVVARRSDVDNESAAFRLEGCIDRNSGVATVALVGVVTTTVVARDVAAWTVVANANTANGSLRIQVTGQAAKTIQWVASITAVETTG